MRSEKRERSKVRGKMQEERSKPAVFSGQWAKGKTKNVRGKKVDTCGFLIRRGESILNVEFSILNS